MRAGLRERPEMRFLSRDNGHAYCALLVMSEVIYHCLVRGILGRQGLICVVVRLISSLLPWSYGIKVGVGKSLFLPSVGLSCILCLLALLCSSSRCESAIYAVSSPVTLASSSKLKVNDTQVQLYHQLVVNLLWAVWLFLAFPWPFGPHSPPSSRFGSLRLTHAAVLTICDLCRMALRLWDLTDLVFF